jgi:hypothetical protein
MYLCVLSSIPDANDVPYDPSPHMNGYKWKHYQVNPKNVEKQIRDLMNEGVDVFFNLCDGTPDALSGLVLCKSWKSWAWHSPVQTLISLILHARK